MAEALSRHGISVNSSPTGTGKTYMALTTAKRLNINPVIVCPKSVTPSWVQAAEQLNVKIAAIGNYESYTTSRKPPIGEWRVKGRIWTWNQPKLLIFDEAARLRGITSQSSKLLRAAIKEKIPTVLLSATLAESPAQMRAIGYALGLCEFEYSRWRAWCLTSGMEENRFGGLIATRQSVQAMKRIRSSLNHVWTEIPSTDLPETSTSALTVPVVNGSGIDRKSVV